MADKIEIEVVAKGLDAVKDDITKLQNSMKKTAKTGSSAMDILKNSWVQAGIAITATIVGIKKVMDFSKEGAKIQQSMEATANQFGISIDKMLAKLKQASGETVSNAGLIESANRAMALNVTNDLGQMADLMEVARARGKTLGLDTEQAFSDIVTGIGRASPLILDNLGIITKGWTEEAKAAGKAFDSQFILNKVLEDGAAIVAKSNPGILSMAERFQKMEASAQNAGDSIKRALSAEVLELFESFGDTGESALEKIEKGIVPLRRGFRALFAIMQIAFTNAVAPIRIFIATMAPITGLVEALWDSFDMLKERALKLKEAFEALMRGDLKGAGDALSASFKNAGEDIKKLGAEAAKNTTKHFKDGIKGVVDSYKRLPGEVKKIFDEIDDLSAEVNDNQKKRTKSSVKDTKNAEQAKKAIIAQSMAAAKTLANDYFSHLKDLRQADLDDEIRTLEKKHEANVEALELDRDTKLAALQEKQELLDEPARQKELDILEERKQAAIRADNEQLASEMQNEIDRINFAKKRQEEEAKIEAEFAAKAEELEKKKQAKISAAKTKAAKADRNAAIITSLVNTAMAITSTLAQAPGGAISKGVQAAIIGGLGAAQTALIASKPIPQFAQGTSFSPGGLAEVGERGPELVNLPQGSQVIPNNEITNNAFDNKQVSINVQANDPIEFVNTLRRTYGLDVFGEA
jgi:hypothetical protein